MYNIVISLKGVYFLIVLEWFIWFYLFVIYGDFFNMKINFGDKVMDFCVRLNYYFFVDLLKIGLKEKEKVYNII